MRKEPGLNLAFEPWIPVTDQNGGPRMVGLDACFRGGEAIVDLAVRPQERVALMRLLLCIAHAALNGPANHAERRNAAALLPDAVTAYLTQWRDSFWLYHPDKPFLQVAGLRKAGKGEDPTPFAKLDFALASGSNSTLFDHAGRDRARHPAPETLALNLLTFQMFSPGGLFAQAFWPGQASPTAKTVHDAPCVCGSMLHAFPRGAHLAETIFLNLCPLDRLRHTYALHREDWVGRPVWERFPRSPDDTETVANATRTYVGRLVPLSRAVLLDDRGLVLGEGLLYPSFANADNFFPAEPSATVLIRKRKDKEEKTLLAYRPDKAVWRELHSIAVRRAGMEDDAVKPGGPQALMNVRSDSVCDLVTVALARDQADILNALESVYPLNPALLEPEGRLEYEAGVREAEEAARRLAWAVETYREQVDGSWRGAQKAAGAKRAERRARLIRNALLLYWSDVESDLSPLFRMVDHRDEESFTLWRQRLASYASAAYAMTCGQPSARHARAYARGHFRLYRVRPAATDANSEEQI